MRICQVSGCGVKHKGFGFCDFHLGRMRRFGDPLGGPPKRLSNGSLTTCEVSGCSNRAVSKHLCSNHRRKMLRYGDPRCGQWTITGRSKTWRVQKDGYVVKWDPENPNANKKTGLVFQHRAVMGEALGRPLSSHESVHHKNGNRSDNRLENLELWMKGQPAGQRVEDLVAFARQIIREYGDIYLFSKAGPAELDDLSRGYSITYRKAIEQIRSFRH